MEKPCARCGVGVRHKSSAWCQPCQQEYGAAWRRAHPEKMRQYSLRHHPRKPPPDPRECEWCGVLFTPKKHDARRFCGQSCRSRVGDLRLKYGLTAEAFRQMVEGQDHRCALCKMRVTGTSAADRWAVDHDHETGRVRALLCGNCNSGLGMFRDDPDLLRAAAQYLGTHHQQQLRVVE